MINAAIIGGAGYTAGELIRILLNHPEVNVTIVSSTSNAGKLISHIHQDLIGETTLHFSESIVTEQKIDVVFMCQGHGQSKRVIKSGVIPHDAKVIDLSNDFRLTADSVIDGRTFVYGLPELNKIKIEKANSIANPGCFATAIQLALLPAAQNQLLKGEVHVNAITGSTGAGQSPSSTTHFSWRNNNVSIYKPFSHQHLGEIGESISSLQSTFKHDINFIPVRGNFTRGIFATVYFDYDGMFEDVMEKYEEFYADSAFTFVSENPLHLKQVVNSNKCLLHLEKHGNKLLVTSIIDNLTKGASGQAVQNMNLMFGFNEKAGLQLKSIFH